MKKDFFERTDDERIYMGGGKAEKIDVNDYESSRNEKEHKFNIFNVEEDEEDEFKHYERKIINNVISKSGIRRKFMIKILFV